MKNIDLINLYTFLNSPTGASLKISMKARKSMKTNLRNISNSLKDLQEIEQEKNEISGVLKEFNEELYKKADHCFQKDDENNALKDLNGDPMIIPEFYQYARNIREELAKDPKYAEEVSKKEQKEKEWVELLNSDVDFEVLKIDEEELNDDLKLSNAEWNILEILLTTKEGTE